MAPSWPQVGSKMAPRWPQVTPHRDWPAWSAGVKAWRSPNFPTAFVYVLLAPSWLQDGLKWLVWSKEIFSSLLLCDWAIVVSQAARK